MNDLKVLKEKIDDNINIVNFISQYVLLKKKGQLYKGLCPFHTEKTASFCIYETKGFFYCFGCKESGDVYAFLMKYKSCTFPQAIHELAEFLSIRIEKNFSSLKTNQTKNFFILDLFKKSAEYFQKLLFQKPNRAYDYIQSRGISDESIKEFHLGYMNYDSQALIQHLKAHSFSLEEQKQSKLILTKTDNYCFFSKRLIFPIFGERKKIVAFGARILDDKIKTAKYLNSPENEFFQKKKIFYGFQLAKPLIIEKKEVFIVEGYIDVIKMFQSGFKNVVSPLGTSLTESHLHILSAYANKIYLLFDGDQAGSEATARALEKFLNMDLPLEILIISFPANQDPCSFIDEKGKEAFTTYLNENKEKIFHFFIHYYFKKIKKSEFDHQKKEYLNKIYKSIEKLKSIIEKREAFEFLSFLLKIPYDKILLDYNLFLEKKLDKKDSHHFFEKKSKINLLNNPDFALALFSIRNPAIWIENKKNISTSFIKDHLSKKIFSLLEEYFLHSHQYLKEKEFFEKKDFYSFLLKNLEKEDKEELMFHLFNKIHEVNPEIRIKELIKNHQIYYIKNKIQESTQKIKKSLSEEEIKKNLMEQQFWMNELFKLKGKN